MNSKAFSWAVRFAMVLVLAVATGALAEPGTPVHFSGIINDYSPSNVMPVGPWEIRGQWTLTLNPETGKADFSAALNMERSDYWVSTNFQDPTNPSLRSAHTHHITIKGGSVTPINGGFEVSGPITITKDGSPAPFSPSELHVDITGGTSLKFSNITLMFQGDAKSAIVHFGTQAIHGVVRKTSGAQPDNDAQ